MLYDREWDTSTLRPFQLVDGILCKYISVLLSGLYPILYSWIKCHHLQYSSQPSHRSSELALSSPLHSWQCCSSCIMPSVAAVLAMDGSVMWVNMHKLYCRTSTSCLSFLWCLVYTSCIKHEWIWRAAYTSTISSLLFSEVTTVVSFSISGDTVEDKCLNCSLVVVAGLGELTVLVWYLLFKGLFLMGDASWFCLSDTFSKGSWLVTCKYMKKFEDIWGHSTLLHTE